MSGVRIPQAPPIKKMETKIFIAEATGKYYYGPERFLLDFITEYPDCDILFDGLSLLNARDFISTLKNKQFYKK